MGFFLGGGVYHIFHVVQFCNVKFIQEVSEP